MLPLFPYDFCEELYDNSQELPSIVANIGHEVFLDLVLHFLMWKFCAFCVNENL
jgi:hypothetical protein